MRENETNKSRDLITPDDERSYDITLRAILRMDEVSSAAQHLLALEMVKIMTDVLKKGQTLFQALQSKRLPTNCLRSIALRRMKQSAKDTKTITIIAQSR